MRGEKTEVGERRVKLPPWNGAMEDILQFLSNSVDQRIGMDHRKREEPPTPQKHQGTEKTSQGNHLRDLYVEKKSYDINLSQKNCGQRWAGEGNSQKICPRHLLPRPDEIKKKKNALITAYQVHYERCCSRWYPSAKQGARRLAE